MLSSSCKTHPASPKAHLYLFHGLKVETFFFWCLLDIPGYVIGELQRGKTWNALFFSARLVSGVTARACRRRKKSSEEGADTSRWMTPELVVDGSQNDDGFEARFVACSALWSGCCRTSELGPRTNLGRTLFAASLWKNVQTISCCCLLLLLLLLLQLNQ